MVFVYIINKKYAKAEFKSITFISKEGYTFFIVILLT